MAVSKKGPTFEFEERFGADGLVCVGVDEVGRGCLAGPVVTAAVILPVSSDTDPRANEFPWLCELNDSKKLSPMRRLQLAELIWIHAQVEVGWCSAQEIDEHNILCASMIAMRRAVLPFEAKAQVVLVDGNMNPFTSKFKATAAAAKLFPKVELLIKGDGRSRSIAAASIVAKVFRDEWITEIGEQFPQFGFVSHKGYSTPEHYAALKRFGPTVEHRYSFAPVKESAKAFQETV